MAKKFRFEVRPDEQEEIIPREGTVDLRTRAGVEGGPVVVYALGDTDESVYIEVDAWLSPSALDNFIAFLQAAKEALK